MTLQDQLTASQQAVESAQTVLDGAKAQLVKDQAAFDAAQPHLTVLQEMEAEAARIGGETASVFGSLISKARSLFGG